MAREKKVEKKITGKVASSYVVSQYYGFDAISLPQVSEEDKERARSLRKDSEFIHDVLPPVEEPLAILRTYKDHLLKEDAQPVIFYCEGQSRGTYKKKKSKSGEKTVGLHIIGTPKSIAEAILIKTAICILEDEGYKDISIEINNVGGKDAMTQFFKELTSYYRKNLNDMNAQCRQLFKDGPHALVSCKNLIKSEILENAPSPLNFLSEDSRDHFKEVVEYLESQNISYEINKDVLGDPHYSTNTVFTILDKKTGKVLATGTRYDQLSRKIGTRTEIPGVSVSIKLPKSKKVSASELPSNKKSKFFFMQLGFDAKLKSLQVIEKLRKAKIPVYQSLSRDKLSSQLENARRLGVSYILMMGQKEAIDNTIAIRDISTHKQESVPISSLISYLNKLK